jgi:hypothetical protein
MPRSHPTLSGAERAFMDMEARVFLAIDEQPCH